MRESGDWLQELPAATRLIFQGDRQARAAAVREWSPGFSTTACRATEDGDLASLWLGPDEFLLPSGIDTGTSRRRPQRSGGGAQRLDWVDAAAIRQIASHTNC